MNSLLNRYLAFCFVSFKKCYLSDPHPPGELNLNVYSLRLVQSSWGVAFYPSSLADVSNMCFSKRKGTAMFCAWICVQVSFVFHQDDIDLQAAHDDQQRMCDLTFLQSAFPSNFFACKQAECFQKLVMQVLPLQSKLSAQSAVYVF